MNLAFEAGRLAEQRGWASVELVAPDSLSSVLPGPGEVIVLAHDGTFLVHHARDVAALHASGKSVAVVSPVILAEDIQAWLPEDCFFALDLAGDEALATAEATGDGQRRQLVSAVPAWPSVADHSRVDSRAAWWSVSDGIIALTPQETIDDSALGEYFLTEIEAREAKALAAIFSHLSVGVAWDRPIFVPKSRLHYSTLLNSAPIRGLKPDQGIWSGVSPYDLGFPAGSNELWIGGHESGAVLTLNVSLGGWPCLLVCGPFFDIDVDTDQSSCIVPQMQHGTAGLGQTPLYASNHQNRPGNLQDQLEPMPTWLDSLPKLSQELVIALLDLWASGFFRGIVAGGIDWFCNHGTDLDRALQVDWAALIARLEEIGRSA